MKTDPKDESTRDLVKRFSDYVFHLRLVHHIYRELYEDEHSKFLMRKTASAFFIDLNNIIVNYLLLEVAKLTDPPQAARRRRENFTISN